MDDSAPRRALFAAQKQEENQMGESAYSAFSLDFTPSDFFVFHAVNGAFTRRNFESADEPIDERCEMTSAIPPTKFKTVCLE
jgi:hypothetical protein